MELPRPLVASTLAAVSLLPLIAPHAAAADLLVLRDGTRLETRGAWQEKGRQIVFTSAAGELSALRASEVDLDASRKATASALAPQPAVQERAASERPVVLALVDSQLGEGSDPDLAAPETEIVLYATSWCGWCRKARALFAELGVEYVERDVEQDPAARLEKDRLAGGDAGVPVVDWRGEVVRGFSEARFRDLARQDAETAKQRELAERERQRRDAEAAADAGGLNDAADAAGELGSEAEADAGNDPADDPDDLEEPPSGAPA